MKRRGFIGKVLKFGGALVFAPKLLFGADAKISDITTVVNDYNFSKEVYGCKGKAIVLFYSNWESYSPTIFQLYRWLVSEYRDKVKFCSYELDDSYNPKVNANWKENWAVIKEKYGVDLLPVTNMYLDGGLVYRVRGSPTEKVPEQEIRKIIVKWIENQ
ncbi:hypothetical protein COV19_06265 [Candidatus Woesearchaeota archaeon CG10_big_fil_rev_8_21_14_0_10_44_13]|nr:MAG: hypothetical protein COV19_06265 [Candidatus Woesearchaeota archaeon CG10_big_fil_rev_8_21_14_0_10_44_13]